MVFRKRRAYVQCELDLAQKCSTVRQAHRSSLAHAVSLPLPDRQLDSCTAEGVDSLSTVVHMKRIMNRDGGWGSKGNALGHGGVFPPHWWGHD